MAGSNPRVALVTGANKGIGFEIVRGLLQKFDGDVILAARNVKLGKEAVSLLEKDGLKPKFLQLDLVDKSTIEAAKRHVEQTYGGLDILVNDAGIAYKSDSPAPFSEQAEMSMKTNFTGTLDVCKAMFPLLRDHARVVNVSSTASHMAYIKCSEELRKQFVSDDLTIEQLERLMATFVE
ncbi:hypothetical protein ScPMuIL_010202 [Solemya velum]